MKALMWKELRENRLKIIIGCVLLTVIGLAVSIAYRFLEGGIPGMGQIPPEYADLIKKLMPDFSNVNAYLYSQWFSKNLQQVGAILTVILLSGAVPERGNAHSHLPVLAAVSRGMIWLQGDSSVCRLVLTVLSHGWGILAPSSSEGAQLHLLDRDVAQLHCAVTFASMRRCSPCSCRTNEAMLFSGASSSSFGCGPVQPLTGSIRCAVWKLRPPSALCTALMPMSSA